MTPTRRRARSPVGVPHVSQSYRLPVRGPWGSGAGHRNPINTYQKKTHRSHLHWSAEANVCGEGFVEVDVPDNRFFTSTNSFVIKLAISSSANELHVALSSSVGCASNLSGINVAVISRQITTTTKLRVRYDSAMLLSGDTELPGSTVYTARRQPRLRLGSSKNPVYAVTPWLTNIGNSLV